MGVDAACVTISLSRLLLLIALALGLAVVAYVWHERSAGAGQDTFESQASKICGEQLPAITNAPDFETALARSRDMRVRLSALTPPVEGQATFADWIAKLKGTEDAAIRGDMAAVQQYDRGAQRDATVLGLADACIYHTH
jgi:hypothetical protein